MADIVDQQLQAMQDQINAMMAAAAQAQAAQVPAAPAPIGVQFAFGPAGANQGIIDYSSTAGIKLYKTITTPLEEKFDGSPGKLLSFMDDLRQKATNFGWHDSILLIGDQHPTNPNDFNLIQNHRQLTMENVQAHAATYMGDESREAQDASMMFTFLRDSMTPGVRARMSTETDKYQIDGNNNGPCYLKALLIKYYVETRATNFHLRQRLQRLTKTMSDLKSDIATFNDYVQEILQNLAAGGETSSDILVNVFEAYLSVPDHAFRHYIERKKETYYDGSEDITIGTLMDMVLNKYNQLKQDGEWEAKPPKQEQIVALMAQLQKVQTSKAKTGQASPSNNSQGDNKKKKAGPRKYPDWRYERNGTDVKLEREGKTYHWCTHHQMWCEHTTEECRAKKKAPEGATKPPKVKQGDAQDPTLSLTKSLVAITHNEDYQSDDEEDDKE
jgi:hypothetical protein